MATLLVAEVPCLLRHFPFRPKGIWKEYILTFFKTPPFKNLKLVFFWGSVYNKRGTKRVIYMTFMMVKKPLSVTMDIAVINRVPFY